MYNSKMALESKHEGEEVVTERRWQQYLKHVLQQLGHQLGGSGEHGWYPLADDPQTCCKIRKGGNNIDIDLTAGSRYLIAEYTKQTPNGVQVVFAPNYIGTPNLADTFDQLKLEEKLKILADAMDGCNHLHMRGFVHCDVNPTNILVKTRSDGKTGLLGDLECLVKEGGTQTGGFGTYHESTYYNNHSVSNNADRKIDVFAFGLLLLASYIGLSEIAKIEQQLNQTGTETRSIRFNQWLEIRMAASSIPVEIQKTIKRMLSSKREERQNLNEVVYILRSHLQA